MATASGVFMVLAPAAMGIAFMIFVGTVLTTRFISLGSVVASASLPPLALATGSPTPAALAAIVSATLIVFRHRSNLARVRVGQERRIGMRTS